MIVTLPFDYSITKPFPRKYGFFLLAFAILSTAAFVTINVFLVGYDVISITTTHFNSAPGLGSKIWRSGGGGTFGCAPYKFQLGDIFRTTISAFSYSIFDVQSGLDANGTPIEGEFLYANEDLSTCDVHQYEISVKPGDRLITATASIKCPGPPGRQGFQALTSWSYSNHAMRIGSLVFPANSLARAIQEGMANISAEAYADIYNKLYTTVEGIPQHVYKVVAEGQPSCDSSPPSPCVVPNFTWYNAIGNTDLNILPNASSIAADEGNLYNVINVFYAAVRLDLGHWTPDNIFTNTTSFKRLIRDTDSTNTTFRDVATSKGMAYVNSTHPPPRRAAIQIPYTCNVMRRKPIGSFVVSVLSATLSMFLGTWGVIVTVLSFIVRKNPGANTCDSDTRNERSWKDEQRMNSLPLMSYM
ncbi:hypothetical protein DFH08DRAFT_887191 [Mycena albidolilacea]|uniref:Uncharacterized protein n=1 Tax=Mycena albidolilacea TaxID=1033008 RepID=A0AAD6ZIT3_9AGAR|nr:hypothetical protein DFH08DRAFT_887191 [Mycena albidolilacea]